MGAGSTAEVAALDPPATQTHLSARSGHYRWSICALLFFAATINYIDRQVIGILKPTLEGQLGWNEIDTAISYSRFNWPMPWVCS